MVLHRFPISDVTCGAFSLKTADLCFNPEDERPALQIRYEQNGNHEGFHFYEARVRQLTPEGSTGIVAKNVKFVKRYDARLFNRWEDYQEEEIEESHHAVASTLTEPQLQGVEWTFSLETPDPLYSIKLCGDVTNFWIVRILREYNYDIDDLPADPGLIDFDTEHYDPDIPHKRFFKILYNRQGDKELRAKVIKWAVMSEHRRAFYTPEVPEPLRLWTIPQRYLINRNFERREERAVQETKDTRDFQKFGFPWADNLENREKGKEKMEGIEWGQTEKLEEEEEDRQPTLNPQESLGEGSGTSKNQGQKREPEEDDSPQGPSGEEPKKKKKKNRKKKKRKAGGQANQQQKSGDGEQGESSEDEEKDDKGDIKKGKEPEQKEDRWWEPTPEELEKEKQKPQGWWGEELWKKRQKEKEEENRKRVEAGGEDRWWDYEEPPNPTGHW
ncbi:hypothetical protein TWF718_008228 [Orbilia javanica]|uniref:Uncharacterized protein n=1 Tax=Orbilia javanica TaxID=47235 RepID=A0AAN8MMR3_9PEZI